MIDQMSYEAARERVTDYRRQAAQARMANEAQTHQEHSESMRFAGPREMVAKIVGRWGRLAVQTPHG